MDVFANYLAKIDNPIIKGEFTIKVMV